MARKFTMGIDMVLTQIKNAVLDLLTSDTSTTEGQVWYRTDLHRPKIRLNGTTNFIITDADTSSVALAGDVTGTTGANTVAANAITNAKLADVATATFKGRTTAGTGDPEDLTTTQAKTLLNLTGTNSGDQTITLTGDVTGSGTGSFVAAIGTGVIVDSDISAAAGIDSLKMLVTANFNLVSHKLINVTDPTSAQDGATKAYVDATTALSPYKASVNIATAAAGTLSTSFAAGQTVDSTPLTAGWRILIKNQVATQENGIYIVQATGAPIRASDLPSGFVTTAGETVRVIGGLANGDTFWTQTSVGNIVGTNALVWVQLESKLNAAAMPSSLDTRVRTSTLNQMTAPTADLSINTHKLTNVVDPTSAQDAATKNYVDLNGAVSSSWKQPVRVATTVNGTLATAYANGQVIDGVTLATGNRILLKDQTTQTENGIYTVNASGVPTRAADMITGATFRAEFTVRVEVGGQARSTWATASNAPLVVGTDAMVWERFEPSLTLNYIGAPNGNVTLNSQKIVNLADPTSAQDAASKNYVDTSPFIQHSWKDPVKSVTVVNYNLAAGTNLTPGNNLNGHILVLGDRFLVAFQTTASENGIYICTAGVPTRAPDMAAGSVQLGATTWAVSSSSGDYGKIYESNGTVTVGTTAMPWGSLQSLTVIGTTNNADVNGTLATPVINGSMLKRPVTAVATANIASVFTTLVVGYVLDGVTLADGDRVLLTAQTTNYENSIVRIRASSSATYDDDWAGPRLINGAFVWSMSGGSANGSKWWFTNFNGFPANTTPARNWVRLESTYDASVMSSSFDTRVRTSRLDQMATPTADVAWGAHKITGLLDPTAAQDAATKNYVDNTVAGLSWKEEVAVATIIAGNLSSSFQSGNVIDGYTLVTGDRILIKDQVSPAQNGIYIVPASGTASRATDSDTDTELRGASTFVVNGSNAGRRYLMTTTGAITVGTTGLNFALFDVSSATRFMDLDNTSGTSTTCTHNFGTRNVIVQLFDNTTYETIEADVVRTSVNVVTITTAASYSAAAFHILIIGR